MLLAEHRYFFCVHHTNTDQNPSPLAYSVRLKKISEVYGRPLSRFIELLYFCDWVSQLIGFDKIGPFFWHFMLLALPFFWPNYANFYALLAEKCSLMLDILNSNSVKHDLTINLITMAEYVPGMVAKIAGTLSYECIPTSIQSHAQRTTGTVKFRNNAHPK